MGASDEDKAALGEALRAWRNRAGVTQGEAGELVGVSGAAVGAWESGRSWPRPAARLALRGLDGAGDIVGVLDRWDEKRRAATFRPVHGAAMWSVQALDRGDPEPLGAVGTEGLVAAVKTRVERLVAAGPPPADEEHTGYQAVVTELIETGRDDECAWAYELREFGVSARIELDDGEVERHPHNPQMLDVVVLLRAKRKSRRGVLAVHVHNGHTAKVDATNLIETIIKNESMKPEIEAVAAEAAVRDALVNNRVKEYTFVAQESPQDRFADARLDGQEIGRIVTKIRPRRNRWLSGGWLVDFLDGRRTPSDCDRIVTFNEKAYDKATVTVQLANGRERTVNVEEAGQRLGRALTYGLLGDDGKDVPATADHDEIVGALHVLLDEHKL